MKTLNIVRDVFAPSEDWQKIDTDDVCEALLCELGTWPEGARLYHSNIAQDCDVTPSDEADIAALAKMSGPFFAVLVPGVDWVIIAAVAIGALLSAAATILLAPSVPKIGNQQTASSNNSLSSRQNRPRVMGRIPDIFGEVRSTPDDIMLNYRIFDADSSEKEISYYCIGRGEYDVSDVRDGQTLVSEIDGESVEFYSPNTSPNSGDPAQLTIGDAIGTGIVTVQKANGVNGQVLYAPNWKTIISATTGNVKFEFPNRIRSTDTDALNFTKYLEAGAQIVMTGTTYDDGGGHVVNLSGTYTVDTVADDEVVLLNVTTVTTDWNILNLMAGNQTGLITGCTIDASGLSTRWVGPFIVNDPDITGLISNIVALNGLYGTNGNQTLPVWVTVETGVTPVDASGTPTGAEVTNNYDLPHDGADKQQKALSAVTAASGRSSVRMRRTTDNNFTYQGTIYDEVKWRDLYATAPLDVTDFGNVTTAQSVTRVTQAAIGIKERKLNALVCRKVAERDGDGFSSTLAASKNIADIFCSVALDPCVGRRAVAELNVAAIYDTIDAVADYFGTDESVEFGYSFDDDQTSAEEMLTAIAQVAFCTPIRRGSVLELVFEQETSDSTLLFNHRNKVPGTEKRTMRFGNRDNFDGVELTYVDSNNYDSKATYTIPEGGSATNPQKIDTVGIRNFDPAYRQAWRAYNKIRRQRLAVEFTATSEAAAVSLTERILVADNTRSGTQDGEVLGQSGMTLTLSQDVTLTGSDSIMLQIPDGSIDVIAITAGAEPNQVVLAEAPSSALSTDIRNSARAAYWILPDDADDLGKAFLVSQKRVAQRFTYAMSAVNYDAAYYSVDRPGSLDFDAIVGNPFIAVLFEDF